MIMDEDQWMYDNIMTEEVDMNDQNEGEVGVNEEHVDCFDAFNVCLLPVMMFCIRLDLLLMKLDLWRISNRKYGCPFKLRAKLVVGGEGWIVKLICGSHNHELAKSLDKKIIVVDMTKSMVKSRNMLLTLKEHNVYSYTTIKQIYNARNAYCSSIRGNVIRDIFWSHLDAVQLTSDCNLVFLIDNTYKTNRYMLSLLDIVGVTPTWMTFSTALVYLEGERLFLRCDALPEVIVTDRDLALMNVVKTIFHEATNLLCRFHIDKNVKAKCKTLVGKKKECDDVMEAWGSLVDCHSEQQFDECLKKFEIACSPWPMFVGYGNQTWLIPHKKRFVKFARWALKRLLQNSLGDLCSVWEAMNNMIMLQHTEIMASFETSTHVVGHVFKVTLYKRLLGMCVHYANKNPSRCGCIMRTTHVFHVHVSYLDMLLMETISKRFKELDVCGKITLKSKLWEISYPDVNSMCSPPEKVKTKDA
ncbi:hypothetical protein HKD37_03G006884 [Glycine soja]